MGISVTLGSLRIAPPLSSTGGPNSPMGSNSPSAVLSPRSPARPNISYDQDAAQNRFRAGSRIAAGALGRDDGGCATEERREVEIAGNDRRDYYSLLGVPREASQEDVRHAYRRLALRYHPDVVPLRRLEPATRCFAAINEAYDTLSDPHKRKAYDDLRPAPSPSYARGSSFGRWRGRNWETDQCWC